MDLSALLLDFSVLFVIDFVPSKKIFFTIILYNLSLK